MSIWGKDIDALYFEYGPVADHHEDCPLRGTATWEVGRFTWSSYTGDRSEVRLKPKPRTCPRCKGIGRRQRPGSKTVHRLARRVRRELARQKEARTQ
jgi:hypothetical protein